MQRVEVLGMGVGNADLPPAYRECMQNADVLVGGKRLLDRAQPCRAEQVVITSPLRPLLERIREAARAGKKVVVVADGDPLFFGIGRRLAKILGREHVRIHPNVTVLQAAAARLGRPWEKIRTVSLHGRRDLAPLLCELAFSDAVAVYTDPEYTPRRIARELVRRRVDTFAMHVFENLGLEDEQVGRFSLEAAAGRHFSRLSFILLERERHSEMEIHVGVDDDRYLHEHGQITKREIRAAGLAALKVRPRHTLWDLGGGSGSVAIEAAILARKGRVFSVEKKPARVAMMQENIRRAGVFHVEAVLGEMPGCLSALPQPDRVFVGGGTGKDDAVLAEAARRLRPGGRIVLHLVLLDSLHRAADFFSAAGWPVAVSLVSVSRSGDLGRGFRMQALNPVFIVSADKPASPVTADPE